MFRTTFSALLLATTALTGACTASEQPIPDEVMVFKSATCPCCDAWVKHMQNAGFKVRTEVRDDLDSIKAGGGITPRLASCHTAKIGGYFIEGHVPAADIKRLLKERPADVIGLTAPGMPMQSPGMQAEDLPAKGFDVLVIKKDGSTELFSRY